jgi:ubiquitin-activating enzyme E1
VLKAASGKFHPIFQWFYFDAIEALPEGDVSAAEFQPVCSLITSSLFLDSLEILQKNSRYDGNIITLGSTLTEKLHKLNYFLVCRRITNN